MRSPQVFAPLLILVFFLQGLYLIRATSPTTDEIPFHMVNGYTYLKTQDYRMSPANPPLLRQWMALPWLAIDPKLDLNKASWHEADSVPFGVEFFYKDNRSIADKLLYSARFMILLLGVALGFVIYRWSAELYGVWGGLLSLTLYTFCPSFLAHASIAHTDVGVTLFSVLSAYFLWRFLDQSKEADLWFMTAAFGLAAAAKFNALFLGPIFLGLIFFKKGPKCFFRSLLMMVGIGSLIIWATYFFEFKPLLAGGVPRVDEKLDYIRTISNFIRPQDPKTFEFLKEAALKFPIPLPSYLLGLAGIFRSHQTSYFHYAFGEWTTKPHWYFYIFSFSVKMTLAFLTLLVLRTLFIKKTSSDKKLENWIVLLPAAALFWITAKDSTGVGVRYLFPVIPLLMVWAGGLVKLAETSGVWKKALVLLAGLNIVSSLSVFPNYLSYFNETVGGVKGGYQYVRGSDVDWGQGLKDLKKYQDDYNIEKLSLEYFGTADPSFYGLRYEEITPEEKKIPKAKVYAVSVFYLEHVEWSHEIDPSAVAGGAIFIYDLRKLIKEV